MGSGKLLYKAFEIKTFVHHVHRLKVKWLISQCEGSLLFKAFVQKMRVAFTVKLFKAHVKVKPMTQM